MEAATTPTAVPVGGSELKPTNNPVVAVSGSGDPNTLYAFTATRLLRSPDGGKTWVDAGPRQPGETVVAINDPNVLYAGQRNDCQGNPANTPLVRSTDGGVSWPDSFPNTQGVRPLLVQAAQQSTVIADDCNLLFSFDGGRTFDSIQPLGPGYLPTGAAASDPSLQFAAVGLNGSSDSSVIVFDMSDPSGSTFNQSPPFLFSSTLDWAGGRLAVATDYGVIISDDNGQSWSEYLRGGLDGVTFNTDPFIGALPFFRDADIGLRDIVIDPTNVNRMWLATNRGVYLTENGGQSWTLIVQQADVQTLAISIQNNLLFVAGPQSTKVYTLNGG